MGSGEVSIGVAVAGGNVGVALGGTGLGVKVAVGTGAMVDAGMDTPQAARRAKR